MAVVAGFSGLLIWLLGPFARHLAGERAPLTARERKRLSVKDRVDALNNVRGNILQSLTGIVVVAGLIFTGLGLRYTASTLKTTQQGQITDRYTKAVDQLGAKKTDIRLGGIYALQRIATDSPRDQPTIMQVLTAYVLEHAQDPPPPTFIRTSRSSPVPLDIDVHAALVVIGERNRHHDQNFSENLTNADLHHRDLRDIPLNNAFLESADLRRAGLKVGNLFQADLVGADLAGADLAEAYLTKADLNTANLNTAHLAGAHLYGADMSSAHLHRADLSNADLTEAHLEGAILTGADLTNITVLANAYLNGAHLNGAHLNGAILTNADLTGAYLNGAHLNGAILTNANLTGAHLIGADLRGADLRQIRGVSKQAITEETRTDKNTKF